MISLAIRYLLGNFDQLPPALFNHHSPDTWNHHDERPGSKAGDEFGCWSWRIIPNSKWLITSRVVGPLPNGHSWLINGGDPNNLLTGLLAGTSKRPFKVSYTVGKNYICGI